jgi:hypothetical protein
MVVANTLAYYITVTITTIKNYGAGAIFTTLHFLHNLQIGQISFNVTLQQAGNTCQGQTL